MFRFRTPSLVATLAFGVVCVLATMASPAAAQSRPSSSVTSISLNPFAILLGGINAEAEMTPNSDLSLGLAGTYFPSSTSGFDDGEHYGSLDFKVRFYPQARAPRGLSVAMTLGMVNYRLDRNDPLTSGATIGFMADHNWVTGRNERFMVGTGLGIRRVITNTSGDRVIPSFRFQIGYLFWGVR